MIQKIPVFVLGGFLALAPAPAFADHIPQTLIDAVFYEFENDYCKRDPDCDFLNFDENDDYVWCMKEILHDEYTRERLENILSFKNANGYFPPDDEEEYDFYAEMVFWVGC